MPWVNGWGIWIWSDSPTVDYTVNHYTVPYGVNGATSSTPPTQGPYGAAGVQQGGQKQNDTTNAGVDPTDPNKAAADRSAQADINNTLATYGLQALGTFAWNEYKKDIPIEQIMLDIRNTPEYKARFPAMATLAAKGQAITEQTYIDYERTASQVMEAAGLPKGFYDQPADFAGFMENNISTAELQSRVNLAKQAVYNSDPETLAALQQYYNIQGGGNHIGDATAYFLDPTRALPAIQNQMIAAQEGGAAARAGYTGLSQSYAERLAVMGVNPTQAQNQFGTLAGLGPLFQQLPGEGGTTPTALQGLQATFEDNASAQLAISNEQAKRKAPFSAGGQFSTTSQGMTGL